MRKKQGVPEDKDLDKHIDFRPHPRGELAKKVLSMIAADVVIPAAFLLPVAPKALKPMLRLMSRRCHVKRSEAFIKSLSYLKKNRFISIAEKDGQQILTLSEDGKKRLLQFNLDQMNIKRPQKWDGYWRIVIFDIPEQEKRGREALRNKLKQLGFYQLQKSCFIHPFDCKSEIDFITELFEVSSYVNFIVAKDIEGIATLQKIFRLSSSSKRNI